jgi:hypothetical protein
MVRIYTTNTSPLSVVGSHFLGRQAIDSVLGQFVNQGKRNRMPNFGHAGDVHSWSGFQPLKAILPVSQGRQLRRPNGGDWLCLALSPGLTQAK